MAQQFSGLSPAHIKFIEAQHIFFVATAAPSGRVNVSPKGMDCLRVIGPNEVAYLDVTGSGAETAAHLKASPDARITIMFCAFDGAPRILRLYGRGLSLVRGTDGYGTLAGRFPRLAGARQIIQLSVDLVQISCGMAVPLYDYVSDRDALRTWAEKQNDSELSDYRKRKNASSIDGLPTGLVSANDDGE